MSNNLSETAKYDVPSSTKSLFFFLNLLPSAWWIFCRLADLWQEIKCVFADVIILLLKTISVAAVSHYSHPLSVIILLLFLFYSSYSIALVHRGIFLITQKHYQSWIVHLMGIMLQFIVYNHKYVIVNLSFYSPLSSCQDARLTPLIMLLQVTRIHFLGCCSCSTVTVQVLFYLMNPTFLLPTVVLIFSCS
jgi:hypothetical protein